MIELRTLGALELTSADGSPLGAVLAQPRRTALLCYLALVPPPGVRRRDTLFALFWPEHDAEQARHALRQSLYFLRRALGAGAIVSRGDEGLALAPDLVRCDAADFERALDDGRPDAALALYRGDLLVGFNISDAPDFERWLDEERARLRQRASAAAWAVAEARERDGDHAGAAAAARRAAAFAPHDETVLRRLVVLLERLGDRATAVRAYEAFAWELEREYELEPSEQTRALLAQIRAGGGDRVVAQQPAAPRAMLRQTEASDDEPTVAPPAAAAPSEPPLPNRATRWRPRTARAWAGSAVLLALLGAGGWRLMPRPASELPTRGREQVIVADFANLTRDTAYGDLIAHVLRGELARSPRLGVVGRETVDGALRRMRRAPGTRLTADVAREVAARQRVNVVVDGDVRAAGAGLVLSASVVEVATGELIHGASETARDSTELLAAIGRLSNSIRQGTGESLASIRATDRLWSFTTSSLPALRKHMAAIRARQSGDYLTAIELLTEAVTLDPDFAHAYVSLAGNMEDAGLPAGRALPGIVRAYGLRQRLTEREQYLVAGRYHLTVTGDLVKATSALRRHNDAVKELGHREGGWTSLVGTTLRLNGEPAAAEAILSEANALRPSATLKAASIEVLFALGKHAEAGRLLDELSLQDPEHPRVLRLRVGLLADSGRYDDAHALAPRIRRDASLRNDLRAQAEIDAIRGRFDEAAGHLRDLRDQALALGELPAAVEIAAAAGRLRILAGDHAGTSEVDDLLARRPVDSLGVLSRPYLPLALFYAEAGQPRRARTWLERYEREFPREFRGPDRWMLHRARAAVSHTEGKHSAALDELRQATHVPSVRVGLFDEQVTHLGDHPELARVYDALGQRDSAIAVYERYLGIRTLSRTAIDAFALGHALERLGGLYEARGDRPRAAANYRRFVELWRDADAQVQPRVEAARRRAAALTSATPPDAPAPPAPPPAPSRRPAPRA